MEAPGHVPSVPSPKSGTVQMRKPYQSPGQDEKLILLYCPGQGLNSRHRSFKHGHSGVARGATRPCPPNFW